MVRGLVNLALLMASILVTIGGVEIALRSTAYGKQFKQKGYTSAGFFPRFYFRQDSVNGHDITPDFPATELNHWEYIETFGRPFTVSSNELGCRDKRMDREERYVLLLGDSFAWGHVPLEHTFGALVEDLTGVRVLKCGVSGYGPRHEQHKLELVVKQVGPPSVIVVGYFVGNDLENDYTYPQFTVLDGYLVRKVGFRDKSNAQGERQIYTDDELKEQIRKHLAKEPTTLVSNIKNFAAEHFLVYNVLRNSMGLRRVAFRLGLGEPPRVSSVARKKADDIFHSLDDYVWLRDAWSLHLDNLRQLKRAADEHNAKLLMVIIPTAEQVYEYLRPAGETLDWEYPNSRLTEYFKKEGISVLDLLPELRKYASLQPKPALDPLEDLYWPHDGHLNMKGNRLAGLLISRYMLERSLLELQDKNKRLSDVKQLLNAS